MTDRTYLLGYDRGDKFVVVQSSCNYRFLMRQKSMLQKSYFQKLEIRRLKKK